MKKLKAPKPRNHSAMALFDKDLPFKPKRETPKTQYKRKPKHGGSRDE